MEVDPFDLNALDDAPPFEVGAPEPEPAYLAGLNPPQREAVEATEGPVLVLAGAGTGKTRVLITRLAHILATGKATPGQVLAVTFTNKAASEMSMRVERLIGRPIAGMAIGTFHSISARILRHHAEIVGLTPSFTILDTDDQVRLLKQLIAARNIDDKRWPARMLATAIDRWKNRALTPDKVPEGEAYAYADGKGVKLYAEYQARLKVLNACDFGDLLLHVIHIFTKHPDVLAAYHARFQYLMVDEYQDANLAQYLWLRLLAQATHNICCVGDDDQSIYGWRGAEVGNILKFEKDFEGAKVIRLEQNYRSSGHILAAASGLISANQSRLGKTLWTEAGEGEKVSVHGIWDGPEEARTVSDEIEALKKGGHAASEIAIMVRAGFQTREFEERFNTVGLPYRIVGGHRFYERQEIRDAVAYLRVIAQPSDDLAFERIINVPKRGLGSVAVQKIYDLSQAKGMPMTAAAELLANSDELRGRARQSLKALMDDFARWREQSSHSHVGMAAMMLDESGYTAMWQNDTSPKAPGRLENLAELVQALGEFENLGGFLEHMSLVMENTEKAGPDTVSIMTLHGAKGLEFETVFLPGWEEGVFPIQRAMDETGLAGLEEERRLAYVGLTRAKKKAHILFAANRMIFGKWQSAMPSRFLDELPEENIERISAAGLYGSGIHNSSGFGDTAAFDDLASSHGNKGPGWQRAQARGQRKSRGELIEGRARRMSVKPRPRPTSEFAIGERVFHEKFGYGLVADVDGDKLEVDFETSGPKRIIDSFVVRAQSGVKE